MTGSPEGRKGFQVVGGKNKSKTWAAGRVCDEEGCAQVLSIYNPGKYCGVHANVRDRKATAGDGRSAEIPKEDR